MGRSADSTVNITNLEKRLLGAELNLMGRREAKAREVIAELTRDELIAVIAAARAELYWYARGRRINHILTDPIEEIQEEVLGLLGYPVAPLAHAAATPAAGGLEDGRG